MKKLQHGTKNRNYKLLEVNQESHVPLDSTLLEDKMLIIIEGDIIKFKDRLTMY